jgi:hypothetical protein
MDSYSARISSIREELKSRTLGEMEAARGISDFDYTGVGFGYNFKGSHPNNREEAKNDIKTPVLDEIEKLAREGC